MVGRRALLRTVPAWLAASVLPRPSGRSSAMAVSAGQNHRAFGARRQSRHPVPPVRARPDRSARSALRGREPLRRRRQHRLRRGGEVAPGWLHDHDRVRPAGHQSDHVRQCELRSGARFRADHHHRDPVASPRRASETACRQFRRVRRAGAVAAEFDQCRHVGSRLARPSRPRAAQSRGRSGRPRALSRRRSGGDRCRRRTDPGDDRDAAGDHRHDAAESAARARGHVLATVAICSRSCRR